MIKSFPTFTGLQHLGQRTARWCCICPRSCPFLIAIICIAIIVLLINSTYGRAFKAIRDDEVAAEAMGINLAKHKMLSFVHELVLRRSGRGALCHVCRERPGEGLYRDHDL